MNLFNFRIINESAKLQSVYFTLKRFISTDRKNDPCQRALNHFDDFYKALFGDKWPSVRLALLSKPKTVAVINNFGDTDKTIEDFQNKGAFDLRLFLEDQKKFIDEPKDEPTQSNSNRIHEIIEHQQHHEEERESHIHPEGMAFKMKVDSAKHAERVETEEDYIYKPEDARTSLDFDLNKAEIDMRRLILPDAVHEGNLSEFIPATKLRGVEEYIPESEYYKYYQPKLEAPVVIENEYELEFPEELKVYSFDRGEVSDFPDPNRGVLDVYNYLKLDGAELLAALVLGVQPNDKVLDLFTSTGSIAYCILQTLRPKFLVCTSDLRNNAKKLFQEHLFNFSPLWNDMLCVTSNPIEQLESDQLFDKVLVNVPSTQDRTSLFESEDNIFHVLNLKTRLKLPVHQCSLLIDALKLVRPGGTVVYTSDTLSPVQNDGVVNQAVVKLWEDNNEQFTIKNLSPALRHTSLMFNFGDYLKMKFGTLVVPFTPVNFGPRKLPVLLVSCYRSFQREEGCTLDLS